MTASPCDDSTMPISLLDRRIYAFADVDRLLRLPHGTARRWIDGYDRAGVHYHPVVRPERTGDEAVTWGEFVETRLLSELRSRGASMQRLRPAVVRLREEIGDYPLAHARPFLDVAGRELVRRIQDEVGVSGQELLVVVRSGQLMMSPPVSSFVGDVHYSDDAADAVVPTRFGGLVKLDPLHQYGRPVVRAVPTEVVAEQFRAGESAETIARLFDLTTEQVEEALRFELSLAETA
jgi:uncharacterized protein (DUF433 family)